MFCVHGIELSFHAFDGGMEEYDMQKVMKGYEV